ncbi:MAG: hypothetical protein PHO02_02895 [Candidatus Nanoarchaeia archaeon]|nr:hypothetical protein [Candidatus Nanoarchaeia archaeon]
MDANKTLEEIGEEGIARLIATRWDYISWLELGDRVAALYGLGREQMFPIKNELVNKGYLLQVIPDEANYDIRCSVTAKGKALVEQYAEKFNFEERFACIMERDKNGWR